MHPYRTHASTPPELPPEMPSEEKFLIALLVLIGGVRVLAAVVAEQPMGAEPTIGLLMLAGGVYAAICRRGGGLER